MVEQDDLDEFGLAFEREEQPAKEEQPRATAGATQREPPPWPRDHFGNGIFWPMSAYAKEINVEISINSQINAGLANGKGLSLDQIAELASYGRASGATNGTAPHGADRAAPDRGAEEAGESRIWQAHKPHVMTREEIEELLRSR